MWWLEEIKNVEFEFWPFLECHKQNKEKFPNYELQNLFFYFQNR